MLRIFTRLLIKFWSLLLYQCILHVDCCVFWDAKIILNLSLRFAADGKTCSPGPRKLKVHLQSKVSFLCPNTGMVLQKSTVGVQTANMYENLWLLYSKTAFDECDVSLDPRRRLLLHCKSPATLQFFPVLFAQFTAEEDGLKFEGGRSYYFIGKLKLMKCSMCTDKCYIYIAWNAIAFLYLVNPSSSVLFADLR